MKAYEKYKSASATTSSTFGQLIFIFEEMLKLLHISQKAVGESNHTIKYQSLNKVIEVLYMLKSGIDIETADENTKNLDVFYGATIVKLENINSHTTQESSELDEVINAINEVRIALDNATSHHEENALESSNKAIEEQV